MVKINEQNRPIFDRFSNDWKCYQTYINFILSNQLEGIITHILQLDYEIWVTTNDQKLALKRVNFA